MDPLARDVKALLHQQHRQGGAVVNRCNDSSADADAAAPMKPDENRGTVAERTLCTCSSRAAVVTSVESMITRLIGVLSSGLYAGLDLWCVIVVLERTRTSTNTEARDSGDAFNKTSRNALKAAKAVKKKASAFFSPLQRIIRKKLADEGENSDEDRGSRSCSSGSGSEGSVGTSEGHHKQQQQSKLVWKQSEDIPPYVAFFARDLVGFIKSSFSTAPDAVKTRAFFRHALNRGCLLAALEILARYYPPVLEAYLMDHAVLRGYGSSQWDKFVGVIAPIGGPPLDAVASLLRSQRKLAGFDEADAGTSSTSKSSMSVSDDSSSRLIAPGSVAFDLDLVVPEFDYHVSYMNRIQLYISGAVPVVEGGPPGVEGGLPLPPIVVLNDVVVETSSHMPLDALLPSVPPLPTTTTTTTTTATHDDVVGVETDPSIAAAPHGLGEEADVEAEQSTPIASPPPPATTTKKIVVKRVVIKKTVKRAASSATVDQSGCDSVTESRTCESSPPPPPPPSSSPASISSPPPSVPCHVDPSLPLETTPHCLASNAANPADITTSSSADCIVTTTPLVQVPTSSTSAALPTTNIGSTSVDVDVQEKGCRELDEALDTWERAIRARQAYLERLIAAAKEQLALYGTSTALSPL